MLESTDASPAAEEPSGGRARPRITRLLILAGCGASLVAAFLIAAAATDRPSFCDTCHEMHPYVAAWAQGPHADTSCIECHVAPGRAARLAHKFVALHEVVVHIRGTARFPLASPPDVPDSRCTNCHATITVSVPGFVHADHETRGPCVLCHGRTGHNVSVEALKAAGIYSGYSAPTTDSAPATVIDGGEADLPGHVDVACSRCHIMSRIACSSCHTAPATHAERPGDCSQCHAVGTAFVFTHPSGSDCASCHTAPANHYGTNCAACHSPSRTWSAATFSHAAIPGGEHTYQSFACVNCHPSSYQSYTCIACHDSATGPTEDD